MRNAAIFAFQHFAGQLHIGAGAAAFKVVEQNGFAVRRRLGYAHVSRNDGFVDLVAEISADIACDRVREAVPFVVHRQNDALNLQIALKARKINPTIHVVIRIFDEDFAQSLQEQFGFSALSGTGMAAPVFAAAAAGADVTNPISVEGQQLSLARLSINPTAYFTGMTVGYVEDNYHLSVVLVRRDHESDMHPTDNKLLNSGDMLAVLGGPEQLNNLMHDNG